MGKLTFLVLLIGSLSIGCENEPEPLYSNGMVTGVVQTRELEDLANATVTAHGPYGSQSATTGTDGIYKLSNLGNGTYEIEFSHEGYGTKYRQGIPVFGNDTVSLIDVRLYEKADYQMPKLNPVLYYSSFPYMDEHSIAMLTDLPKNSTEEMQIRIFVNDTEEVSDKNYLHSDQAHAVTRDDGSQVLVAPVNPQIVNGGGERLFTKGQTLYLIAYVCSIREENGEFSKYYGLPIFSTVDQQQHSPVIEFKAP